jgi:hypothetical protein
VLHHVVAQVVADLVSVPAGVVEQPLHPIGGVVAGLFGQLPAVLALGCAEQALEEPAGAAADLDAAKPWRDPLAQRLQFACPVVDLFECGIHASPRFAVHEARRLPQQNAAGVPVRLRLRPPRKGG